VIDIVAQLDPTVFAIAPVNDFFDMANANPTFADRYT
jgi:hypothetical protein